MWPFGRFASPSWPGTQLAGGRPVRPGCGQCTNVGRRIRTSMRCIIATSPENPMNDELKSMFTHLENLIGLIAERNMDFRLRKDTEECIADRLERYVDQRVLEAIEKRSSR